MSCLPLLSRHRFPADTEAKKTVLRNDQERLKELGYYDGKADELFGPETQLAVEAFQAAHALQVDGVLGPNTRKDMYGESARRAPQSGTLTAEMLSDLTGRPEGEVKRFVEPLKETMKRYDITTPLRQQHFLAQVLHESMRLGRLEESFHYSPGRAVEIFEGRNGLSAHQLRKLARQGEEALANAVYGGKWGARNLGNNSPGDGWRFHGRGAMQLTGRDNYEAYHEALLERGEPRQILQNPGLVAELPLAIDVAGWFWSRNNLNELADANRVVAVTKRINGGRVGLQDRRELLRRAKRTLPAEGAALA